MLHTAHERTWRTLADHFIKLLSLAESAANTSTATHSTNGNPGESFNPPIRAFAARYQG